jgi:GT2 family glycosyltransferase
LGRVIAILLREPLPRVLVVVVNMNGNPYVSDCVKSILNTDYPNFDLLFFDGGSTDGSHLAVKEICRGKENVLLLRSHRTTPLTHATNLAIATANHRAEYVAFVDNDTIVNQDWLKKLMEVIRSNPSLGSCQSLLLRANPPGTIDGTGDFMDVLGHAISRHSGMQLVQVDLKTLDLDIFSARSAAMVVRRDLYDGLGGLDEAFGIGFEDVDLGWRIRLAGFSTRLVMESIVIHRAGSSTGKLSRSYIRYLGTKNRLQMLVKNYEVLNLLRYVPVRLALDVLACILLFLLGRRQFSFAIIRGLLWNLKNIPGILNRRSLVQGRFRKVSDSELIGHTILTKMIISPVQAWRLLTTEEYNRFARE